MPETATTTVRDGVTANAGLRRVVVVRTALAVLLMVGVGPDVGASRRPYRPSVGICGAAARGKIGAIVEFFSTDPTAVHAIDGGATALHWAARYGHEDAVKLLLERGAIADARATDGGTPLHLAALMEESAIVAMLLPHYSEVDIRDCQMETPLYCACRGTSRPEIVRRLLERGANPNVKNAAGTTALQSLAFHGESVALRMLVESGADVNARGFRGATALHWAVDGRRLEIVRFLLDRGAAVTAQDDDSRTPLQWCISESKEARFGALRRLKRIEALLREHAVSTPGGP